MEEHGLCGKNEAPQSVLPKQLLSQVILDALNPQTLSRRQFYSKQIKVPNFFVHHSSSPVHQSSSKTLENPENSSMAERFRPKITVSVSKQNLIMRFQA